MRASSQSRRRGTAYVIVLSTSMIVMTLGVSALLAVRAQVRSAATTDHAVEARLNANAGVDLALYTLYSYNSAWRDAFTSGAWVEDYAIGHGTFSVTVVDPIDDDLADSHLDPIVIRSIGTRGEARAIVEVELRPDPMSIKPYRSAVMALTPMAYWPLQDDNSTTVAADIAGRFDEFPPLSDGQIVSNGDFEIESTEGWSGDPADVEFENKDDDKDAHTGERFLKIKHRDIPADAGRYALTDAVTAGESYDLDLYAYMKGKADSLRVRLEITSTGSGTIAYDIATIALEKEVWTQVIGSVTPTWSGDLISATLVFDTTTEHEEIRLDDVSFRPSWAALIVDNPASFDGAYNDGVDGAVADPISGDVTADFNGADGFVTIPHHSGYLLDDGTVSFWFNADNLSGDKGLFSKDSMDYDTGGHFSIYLSNGKLYYRLQSTSTTKYLNSSSLSAGRWYHVAATFGPNGMKLYLDGEQVGSSSYTGGLGWTSGALGNQEPIAIGVNLSHSSDLTTSGWIQPFAGRIVHVAMFDKTLTAAEIAELHEAGNPYRPLKVVRGSWKQAVE